MYGKIYMKIQSLKNKKRVKKMTLKTKTRKEIIEELREAQYIKDNRFIINYSNRELNDSYKIIQEDNEKWIKLNSMLDYLNGWLATDLSESETKLIDLIYKDIEGEKKKITDA